MEKKSITHFTAGLISGGLLIVYSLILNFMDLMSNQALGSISYLILLVCIIVFILQYAKAQNNERTFGQLFTFGFKSTAIATLMVIAFQVIFFVVFPEYKEKFFDLAREGMVKQGQNEEQIEMGIGFMQRFFWVFIIGGSLFFLMLVGGIASLIGAAVAKKNPATPFQ
jgi:c-di-AMP phosphodiesterase-like protein